MGPIMAELRDGREHRTGRSKKSRQTIFRGRNTIRSSTFDLRVKRLFTRRSNVLDLRG